MATMQKGIEKGSPMGTTKFKNGKRGNIMSIIRYSHTRVMKKVKFLCPLAGSTITKASKK